MSDWTVEKALELAVSMEEESIQLYASAQNRIISPGSKQFLKELEQKNLIKLVTRSNKIQIYTRLDTDLDAYKEHTSKQKKDEEAKEAGS